MEHGVSPVVTIAGYEYKVLRYSSSDQQVLGPRFSSGDANESDLTIKKTLTFHAKDASTFRPAESGSLIPRISMGEINENENILAPSPQLNTAWSQLVSGNDYSNTWDDAGMTGATLPIPNAFYRSSAASDWKITDRIWWRNKFFIGIKHGNSCSIVNVTDGVNVTLPATFTTSGMGPHFATRNRVCYVANNTNGMHYLSSLTAVTKVTGASGNFKQIWNMNGKMYALSSDAQGIYEWTGSTTSDTYTLVADVRDYTDGQVYPSPMAVLNGRTYLGVHDQIVVFDGVRAYTFTNDKPTVMREWQGSIYYDSEGRIMRTNGSTIEVLFDLSPQEVTNGVTYQTDGIIHDIWPFKSKLYFMISHRQIDYTYSAHEFLQKNIMLPADIANDGSEPYGAKDGLAAYAYNGKEMTLSFTTGGLGHKTASYVFENPLHRAAQFIEKDRINLYVARYEKGPTTTGVTKYARVLKNVNPLRVVFRPTDFNFPVLFKKILGFSVVFNANTHHKTSPGHFSGYDWPLQIYYRVLDDPNYPGPSAWVLCKEWKDGVTAENTYTGSPSVDIPASDSIEFMLVTWLDYQDELPELRGLISFSVEYLLQTPYKAQWNLMLGFPMNIEDNLAQTLVGEFETNSIRLLRDNQDVFTFIDPRGVEYDAIIDSFEEGIDAAYGSADNEYISRLTVVIREV